MERLTYRTEQGIPEIYGIPSHIAIERLCAIEDILGDDYDLDRLKEIVEADREARLEIKVKAKRCPKCGKFRLFPRIDWKYYYCFHCKTQFTKEEAEAALRRIQDEGVH